MTIPVTERQPEEVLKPETVGDYKKRRDAVARRFVAFRTMLFILKRLEGYPFELFDTVALGPHFWKAIRGALIEGCILRAWQLTEDDGGFQPANLRRLKTFVDTNARPELVAEVRVATKAAKFDSEVNEILKRVDRLRSQVVAHVDDITLEQLRKIQLASLDELVQVEDALGKLFAVVCFGFGHGTLPAGYAGKAEGMTKDPDDTDVDRLLALMAGASDYVNAPEAQPDFWNVIKEKWTEEGAAGQKKLEAVNYWRSRMGKPAA